MFFGRKKRASHGNSASLSLVARIGASLVSVAHAPVRVVEAVVAHTSGRASERSSGAEVSPNGEPLTHAEKAQRDLDAFMETLCSEEELQIEFKGS